MEKELIEKVKYLIDKGKSLSEICKDMGLKEYEVIGLVSILKDNGLLVDYVNGEIIRLKKALPKEEVFELPNDLNHLKLLLLSDTHLCSKFDRVDILDYLYDKAEDLGVKHVLHSGDFTDGRSNRPEHIYELKELSYEGQVQYCVDKYPKFSGKTYVIQGNHDDWWYKSCGSEIVKSIARQREDLVYLGPDQADMKIGSLRIKLFHGKGGQAYAKSYKLQKFVDALPVANRPHILETGHIHQSLYFKQDQTHCFQTSCLQDQTPFARSLGLSNDKSVWWVDVDFDNDGNVYKITPELETFGEKRYVIKPKTK